MSTQTWPPQHVLMRQDDKRCWGFVCGGTACIQGFPSNARHSMCTIRMRKGLLTTPSGHVHSGEATRDTARKPATSRIRQRWLEAATAGEELQLQSSSSMRMRMPFTRPEEADVDSGRVKRLSGYGLGPTDLERLRFAWGGLTDPPAGVKPK